MRTECPAAACDFFPLLERPSEDGCFITYWGLEISTPKLSANELIELFGGDDSGVSLTGGYGRLRKMSRKWLSSRDQEAHFDALRAQLPSAPELHRLKSHYHLTLNFYRFWLHAPGVQIPAPSNAVMSFIGRFGAGFEDLTMVHQNDHRALTSLISFIVRGSNVNVGELSDAIGAPTKVLKPTDIVKRRGNVTRARSSAEGSVVNISRNQRVFVIESQKLTASDEWQTVLDAMLEYLGPPPANWRDYLFANKLEAEFSVLWSGQKGATEPILSADQFALMRSYCATWSMTPIYHDGHDFGWY
ncbi:hypothetical protein [Roseospirillum parvum]|uniref:Uncharacterized protein n=1 Tax=Roseospirillum parvum TaxID=83401 RepID=A0A1G7YNS6_9PROT|nr:hypothetical protein [Roseospirillum parvum]SDG97966.1 hypothetical protein SAMN05421742_103356 [Roseospirillum parvum]